MSTCSKPGWKRGSLAESAASAVRCPPAEPPVTHRKSGSRAVLGAVLADPADRALHVHDVVGEGRLRREPVVDREADPAAAREMRHQRLALLALVADHPGAAVDLEQRGPTANRAPPGAPRRAGCDGPCRPGARGRTRCRGSSRRRRGASGTDATNPWNAETSESGTRPSDCERALARLARSEPADEARDEERPAREHEREARHAERARERARRREAERGEGLPGEVLERELARRASRSSCRRTRARRAGVRGATRSPRTAGRAWRSRRRAARPRRRSAPREQQRARVERDAQGRDVGVLVVLERAQRHALALGLEREDHAEGVAALRQRARADRPPSRSPQAAESQTSAPSSWASAFMSASSSRVPRAASKFSRITSAGGLAHLLLELHRLAQLGRAEAPAR